MHLRRKCLTGPWRETTRLCLVTLVLRYGQTVLIVMGQAGVRDPTVLCIVAFVDRRSVKAASAGRSTAPIAQPTQRACAVVSRAHVAVAKMAAASRAVTVFVIGSPSALKDGDTSFELSPLLASIRRLKALPGGTWVCPAVSSFAIPSLVRWMDSASSASLVQINAIETSSALSHRSPFPRACGSAQLAVGTRLQWQGCT